MLFYVVTIPVIAICLTINSISKAKYEAMSNDVQVFHCPDCRKFYHGEWDNEPVTVEVVKTHE